MDKCISAGNQNLRATSPKNRLRSVISEIGWFPDLLLFWFSMAKRNQRVFFGVISPKHGSPGLLKGAPHLTEFTL